MVSVKSTQKYSTACSFHPGDTLKREPGDLLFIDLMPFAILKFWVCLTFSILVMFKVIADVILITEI